MAVVAAPPVTLVQQSPVGPLQGPVPVVPAPQVVYYQVPPAQPVATPTPLAYATPPKPYIKGVKKVVICVQLWSTGPRMIQLPQSTGAEHLALPVSPSGQGPVVQYQVVPAPSSPSQPGAESRLAGEPLRTGDLQYSIRWSRRQGLHR